MEETFPQVVLIQNGSVMRRAKLTGTLVTVGRAVDNALMVREAMVARYHLRLVATGGRWLLQDLETTHGTYLNGVPSPGTTLEHGDVVSLAKVCSLVYLEHPDDEVVEIARLGRSPHAPEPGPCPACWNDISRPRQSDPLPDRCPHCRFSFVPVETLGEPNLVRTRFRLNLRALVTGIPCVIREPLPSPPMPLVDGAEVPAAPIVVPQEWGSAGLRHAAPITCLGLTPTGHVRAGDTAGEVRTWDVDSGAELERFSGPGVVMALSRDAEFALVETEDRLKVFTLEDGRFRWEAISAGGSKLVALGQRGDILLHADGALHLHTRLGDPTTLMSGYTPTAIAAIQSRSRAVQVLVDLRGVSILLPGEEPLLWNPAGCAFHAAALTGLGRTVAVGVHSAGPRRGTGTESPPLQAVAGFCIALWQPLTGSVQVVADGLPAAPTAVAISDDEQLVGWADGEGRVSLVRARDGTGARDCQQHARPVRALAIDQQHERAISAGLDGRLRTLRLDGTSEPDTRERTGHAGGSPVLSVSGDGQRLASLAFDGLLRIWDISSGGEVSRWPLPVSAAHRLALAPAARRVAAYDAGRVTAWITASGQWLWSRVLETRGTRQAMAWNDDGRFLMLAHEGTVQVLEANRGTQISRTQSAFPADREPIAILQGSRVLARGPESVGVYPAGGGPARDLRVPMNGRPAAVAPDGTHLALLRGDVAIDLLDLATGEIWTLRTFESIAAVAVSPGGRYLAVAFAFLGLVVWDAPARRVAWRWYPARRLSPSDQRLDALAFTPDGAQLLAATREGPLLRFRLP